MFGEKAMVELVGAIGYYGMIALTLNAFNVPGPGARNHYRRDGSCAIAILRNCHRPIPRIGKLLLIEESPQERIGHQQVS